MSFFYFECLQRSNVCFVLYQISAVAYLVLFVNWSKREAGKDKAKSDSEEAYHFILIFSF